jgi:3-isopropylmalate dehydrogenase
VNKTYRIGVIPGDCTGPEVVAEGMKVLNAVARKGGFRLAFQTYDFGGERYLKTGEILPDPEIDNLRGMDALYLGAIGHPKVKPGVVDQIVLKIRFSLDQYVNLRPCKLLPGVDGPLKHKGPEDIDFVIVRENTEGLYAKAGGVLKKGTQDEVATQESINTRKGVERCIRYAFDYCHRRNRRRKLTLVAKTNVLIYASDLWERAFYEVGKEYPDIELEYVNVDAACMWMVKNPERFVVVVTDNMMGDIISDLAAMIQGGLGIAAGGNINPTGTSMFEPMGGSAPKYTGMNAINPLAAILAGNMMLEHLGEIAAAQLIEDAVIKVLTRDLKSLEAGKMGYGTSEVGDLVVGYVGKS